MPTKFRVEITDSAENDIEEIWTFLTEDNPEAATRFVVQIENRIDTLEHFPERCQIASESGLLGTRYRQLLVGNDRVIFRASVKTVFVLRVIHAARLLDISLFEEAGP
ncbi:MAG: type II toxin-antitoxin system RelE/ParE family toxin [Acidobacteriota bacterium]